MRYLDDPEVVEILIAGPQRIFVSRTFGQERAPVSLSERGIRVLADRLVRVFSNGPLADVKEVQSGRIAPDMRAVLIGAPRGPTCPLIRLIRDQASALSIEAMADRGFLGVHQVEALHWLITARRSVVFAGPYGARGAEWVGVLGAAWMAEGRVALVEAEGGSIAAMGVGHVVLNPEVGIEGASAVAADVIVVPRPFGRAWTGLVQGGRPFVAALEAPDPSTALERLVAWVLAGGAELSRAAAEAMIAATVDRIVFLAPTVPSATVVSQWSPRVTDGGVRLEAQPWPSAAAPNPAGDARPETPGRPSYPLGSSSPALASEPTRAGHWTDSTDLPLPTRGDRRPGEDLQPSPPSERRPAGPAYGGPGPEATLLDSDGMMAGSIVGPAPLGNDLETLALRDDFEGEDRLGDDLGVARVSSVSGDFEVAPALTGDDLGLAESVGTRLRAPTVPLSPALDDAHDPSPAAPAPHDLTQAAPIEEMLSGVVRVANLAFDDPDDVHDARGPSDFESDRTPVGPMFEGRQDGAERVRRSRRSDPRRRRGGS